MPQFADFEQARAWLAQHPQVRYVDLLLPDLMGIPRGKRVTSAELEGVHRHGLLLPASMFALDVLGGTVQSTGLGFDEGDADRVCLPLPGSLAPVTYGHRLATSPRCPRPAPVPPARCAWTSSSCSDRRTAN